MQSGDIRIRGAAAIVAVCLSVSCVQAQVLAKVDPSILSDPTVERALPVIRALQAQGYTIVSINKTLLNRVRIRAQDSDYLREIVVSPSSGEILRDAVVTEFHPMPNVPPQDQTFVPLLPVEPPAAKGPGQ
ncbi:MAG: hypothetical protein GC186_16590 [Rhodobacteraceae bacterium]|nr:hypothetical protein [Paracoccaceae bacterium]